MAFTRSTGILTFMDEGENVDISFVARRSAQLGRSLPSRSVMDDELMREIEWLMTLTQRIYDRLSTMT